MKGNTDKWQNLTTTLLPKWRLKDLRFMLQKSTPLNKFLKDNGIEINVDKRIIKIDEIPYTIPTIIVINTASTIANLL